MTAGPDTEAYRVEVDPEVCVSSSRCMAAEPAAFSLDADGISRPGDLRGIALDRIVEAAKHCPVRAISVIQYGHQVDLSD
jgi:ferredoxin